ncbi:hypothetical protein EXIGLDRAFT_728058 [Exidia glandulosa HHB12029]|uniref:Pinin/SDK/MemA protein domain-containing protein n=1 Tax=Exidia glandulosa HHB12029 TaxID=1314781 RepID=A0A165D327_EXIGL|nr:hypothetical protein EXIGLDRAFT_728058 [Exidia glandulosa HHB12029]
MAESPQEVTMDASPPPPAQRDVSVPLPEEPTPAPEPIPAPAPAPRVRPKIDLQAAGKKRTMFGMLVGTLNKAKIEDKERSASEAAKKRAILEERLQKKLTKETSAVRKTEEARRGRMQASKKEEELGVKGGIIRSRMHRLPTLAHFLLTSDSIPLDAPMDDDTDSDKMTEAGRAILIAPPRAHPPPLFFLPAKLTDAQKSWLERRKKEVDAGLRAEWRAWVLERTAAQEEISTLRKAASEGEVAAAAEVLKQREAAGGDVAMDGGDLKKADNHTPAPESEEKKDVSEDVKMAVDESEPPGKDGEEKVEY